ncbi:MAG: YiiX/YebB-like N1pC/P60 family cysteine hydrolase [Planctomycetota bacterium]|jgi:hypothetical protein
MSKQKIITILRITGAVLTSSFLTLPIGYYLGDRGLKWFPETIDIMLICLFLGITCFLGSAMLTGLTRPKGESKIIKKRILILPLLLVLIVSLHFISCQLSNQTPLTQLPAEEFQQTVQSHHELLDTYDKEMDSLVHQMQSREELFNNPDRSLTASDEVFLRQCWLALYNYAFGVNQIRLFYQDWYHFDISRSQRPRHVQSYLMVYGADIIGYEKALRIIDLINQNPTIVAFLNTPHPDTTIGEDSFSKLKRQLFGSDCHTRIVSGSVYLQWLEQGLKARNAQYAGTCLTLWNTIDSRLALVDQMDTLDRGKTVLDADIEYLRQGFSHVWFPAQKSVAEWMGDTRLHRVGQYLITPKLQETLIDTLEPGDIMLSRKNWYLSNVGLPGFWPHAILYIGNPDKLAAYFDDPQVNQYLFELTGKDISFVQYMSSQYPHKWLRYTAGTGHSDYHVIEAIKYGVLLNPMSKACGDYMAAIRPKLDKIAKAQAIIEAFKHLDKPYDFDFDFATDHALVCTELVWRSYRPDNAKQGITLNLIEMAGRKTLPANEIAKAFIQDRQSENRQFDFVCFIDTSEKQEKAFIADEEAFIESVSRAKWSFLQK